MKTVLTLGTGRNDANALLVEIGPDYYCYGLLDESKKSFDRISYFEFDELELEEQLGAALKDMEGEYEKIMICNSYPEALLTPQHLFKDNHALLDVLYEDGQRQYFNDMIQEWQIMNQYSLPTPVYQLLLEKFPSASYCHAYTPVLKIYNGFVAPNQVDIHFSLQHFRVIVKKEGQLHLAQTYRYKTPLDVVYYLLKIFSEFRLDQSEAFVIVSGLVEKDSAMYTEMHNYFVNIHFAQAPVYAIPGDEYPHYYFTSLYNLAACVS